VTIVHMAGSEVAAKFAAASGCAFDFDVDVDSDFCPRRGQPSGGVASTPFNSARQRLDMARKRLGRH
jgi:hypothetical protein